MIWFDLVTPKSVLFFEKIIKEVESRGKEVLVTARESLDYREVVDLLKLRGIPFFNRGGFGGASLREKLEASIDRKRKLMEFVSDHHVEKLVCLCSVDANRVAFGLGIPIVNFYDIPLSDYKSDFRKALPQARLTLPLSSKVFHPYIVPRHIFTRFAVEEEQINTYNFYDVLIWLHDFKPDRSYFEKILDDYGLDRGRPTIVVREEEYKSSYVKKRYPILYEGIREIERTMDVNIIVIPRYEAAYLEEQFPFAAVLKEKIVVQHLLAFADLFIGGGGTLNTESCYFGTPTISTRSFISHYDKVMMDEGLMERADSAEDLVEIAGKIMGRRRNPDRLFGSMSLGLEKMVDQILL